MNKYLGTVEIELEDRKYTLRYDWTAISEVNSKYGQGVLSKLNEVSPFDLAGILACGLRADNVTADDVIKISPPILQTMKCILKAIEYSYYGPEGAPKEQADTKKNPE